VAIFPRHQKIVFRTPPLCFTTTIANAAATTATAAATTATAAAAAAAPPPPPPECSMSYDRLIAPSKVSSPQSAIHCFLSQIPVFSCFLTLLSSCLRIFLRLPVLSFLQ
jgi:hypothetical protein